MLSEEIEACLASALAPQTLILTLGNPLRRDDGVGPYIAEALKTSGNPLTIVNALDQPENYLEDIFALHPARVIIIDAADFGGAPGEARLINPDALSDKFFSTHALPLSAIAALIQAETAAQVAIIGIQARDFDFGEGLSPEVRATADKLIYRVRPCPACGGVTPGRDNCDH